MRKENQSLHKQANTNYEKFVKKNVAEVTASMCTLYNASYYKTKGEKASRSKVGLK